MLVRLILAASLSTLAVSCGDKQGPPPKATWNPEDARDRANESHESLKKEEDRSEERKANQ